MDDTTQLTGRSLARGTRLSLQGCCQGGHNNGEEEGRLTSSASCSTALASSSFLSVCERETDEGHTHTSHSSRIEVRGARCEPNLVAEQRVEHRAAELERVRAPLGGQRRAGRRRGARGRRRAEGEGGEREQADAHVLHWGCGGGGPFDQLLHMTRTDGSSLPSCGSSSST